jgi:hypothetical protein
MFLQNAIPLQNTDNAFLMILSVVDGVDLARDFDLTRFPSPHIQGTTRL